MNRKQKIVVSIVGIIIVALTLIGITYAYYVTRINGSTTTNISGTMANLRLLYGDGNGLLKAEDIMPGQEIAEKTFTVENTGNGTVKFYVLLDRVTNGFTRKEDLTYTITCKVSGKNTECKGKEETQFPSKDEIIITDKIATSTKYEYTLKVYYKEADVDQSADMGAEFKARVNINNGSGIASPSNPYEEGTLAYNVIHNSDQTQDDYKFDENRTTYVEAPYTIVAQEISKDFERELSKTPDKYTDQTGNESYYYRGNVEDNYLTFNNMCWRIVRVQGDGSTKIVLQDKSGSCSLSTKDNENAFSDTSVYYGYSSTFPYVADYVNSAATTKTDCLRTKLQNWFNKNFTTSNSSQTEPSNDKPTLKDEYEGKIKYEEWEIGDWTTKYNSNGTPFTSGSKWYFEPYVRLYGLSSASRYATLMPSESETVVSVNDYVATLTADEVAFAGAIYYRNNSNYYLYNSSDEWWILSPSFRDSSSDSGFIVETDGSLVYEAVYMNGRAARPAVVLESSVQVKGEGTLTNPYVVS